MKRLNLTIKVCDDLEIIDKCYKQEINHSRQYDRIIIVESSPIETVIKTLSTIGIRSQSGIKQKLAEHCNNIVLSHIGYLCSTTSNNKSLSVSYPHLQISVTGIADTI